MLDKKIKLRVINEFKTHASDTGSTEVQIAILTEEISQLSKHLKHHRKDNSSRRGLLRKVNERRRLLKYLSRENVKSYERLAAKLKLKKVAIQEVKDVVLEEEEDVVLPMGGEKAV